METKELRIGNYIYQKGGLIKDQTLTVLGLKLDDVLLPNEGINMWVPIDFLEPITLTEEWLIKFGLEERYAKGEWSWHMNNKWTCYTEISKSAIGGYKLLGDYPPIKYVHQLQNIYFALTGEELTIK